MRTGGLSPRNLHRGRAAGRAQGPAPTVSPAIPRGLIAGLLGAVLSLCAASGIGRAGELKVTVGPTVEISSSYRYCWYPKLHQFPTGEIMATMRMHPDEIHPEGEFSAYCISRDRGKTWSRRYPMGAGANVDAAYTRLPRKDGTLLVLAAGYGSLKPFPPGQAKQFHASLTRHSRGGMEFTQIRDAVIRLSQPVHMEPTWIGGFSPGPWQFPVEARLRDASKLAEVPKAVPWGAIIEALNGDLLTTLYYTTAKDPRFYRLVLIRSTDDGNTWDQDSIIAAIEPGEQPPAWAGNNCASESALLRLADKRLHVIFSSGAVMGQAWSSDDGETWTEPTSTGFTGVAPRSRLLSNGVVACTYGRPGPVTIMFSSDGTAEKWSHVTEIFPGRSTRYTDFIEIEPGRVLVVYDSIPRGSGPILYAPAFAKHDTWNEKEKNTVYGTFIEVRRRVAP